MRVTNRQTFEVCILRRFLDLITRKEPDFVNVRNFFEFIAKILKIIFRFDDILND